MDKGWALRGPDVSIESDSSLWKRKRPFCAYAHLGWKRNGEFDSVDDFESIWLEEQINYFKKRLLDVVLRLGLTTENVYWQVQ